MKTLLFITTILCALTAFSCKKTAETSPNSDVDAYAVKWQNDYKTFDPEKVKPYLDEANFAYFMQYRSQFTPEEIKSSQSFFDGQKSEVISSKVEGNTAEVTMCCDGMGGEFILYLDKVGDSWKVNFEKSIQYAE